MQDQPILHILLVEDNPGDARLIQEDLRETAENVQVTVCPNLQEGLTLAQTYAFHACLLDLSLPDSFGLETLVTFCEVIPHMPVVVLTGFNDKNIGVQAVQRGAQDYLIKGDTDGKTLLRTVRYAVERHSIEEALRQSQEEYRSLIEDVFESSTVAVLILDRDFRIIWLNGAVETYFGIARTELIGQDKRDLIESTIKCIFADPDAYSTSILDTYQRGVFDQRLECHVNADINREERWLEHWSQPIRSGMYRGGRIEHYTDITERKRVEASEREKAQILAASEERQRLARELHDSVSQTLFTTTLMSESALRQWEANPQKAHDLLNELHKLTNSALAEMRLLLLELRPAALTQLGLNALITQLAGTLQLRSAAKIMLALDEVPPLQSDIQVALYRIVQEALNNIIKHAQATQVKITLSGDEHAISLLIEDNGRGFDAKQGKPTSFGLQIMQERAAAIGAEYNVVSVPGVGTRITLFWSQNSIDRDKTDE
jgi:PAS domain S-box-containing protein